MIKFIIIRRQNISQKKFEYMPRKGENIYKRKDKRWEGRYIKCRNENSRAVYGYVYGKSSLEVKSKLKDRKQTASVPKADKNVIFRDYALECLDIKKNNVKQSSYARYNTTLQKHILPVFGSKAVTDISNTMAQEFICRLKKVDCPINLFRIFCVS